MSWKNIVKGVAPTLATAMGGPLAGMATKAISEKLLGKSSGTDSELAAALLDPQGLVKLKEIEAEFEAEMKRLDVDLERIAVDDRKSARMMASNTSLLPQVLITGALLTGFFIVLHFLFFSGVELDDSLKMAASVLFGALGTNVTLSMKFWFGGSPQDSQNATNMYNAIPREQLKK